MTGSPRTCGYLVELAAKGPALRGIEAALKKESLVVQLTVSGESRLKAGLMI